MWVKVGPKKRPGRGAHSPELSSPVTEMTWRLTTILIVVHFEIWEYVA